MENNANTDIKKLVDDILRLSYKTEKYCPVKNYIGLMRNKYNLLFPHEELETNLYSNWKFSASNQQHTYNSFVSAFMESHALAISKYYYEIDYKDFRVYLDTCNQLNEKPNIIEGTNHTPVFPGIYDDNGVQTHFFRFLGDNLFKFSEDFGHASIDGLSISSTKYTTGSLQYITSMLYGVKLTDGRFHDELLSRGLSPFIAVLYQFYEYRDSGSCPPTEVLIFFDEKYNSQYSLSCGSRTGGDPVEHRWIDQYCCSERNEELKRHFSDENKEERRKVLHGPFLQFLDFPYHLINVFKYLDYRLEITVDQKVQVGTRKRKKKRKDGSRKSRYIDVSSPIYKIIKSIKINYENEEEILSA